LFAYNLANVSLTIAGAYINGFGRYAYLHKNRIKRAPKDLFEHATVLRVTANCIQTTAGLFEDMMLAASEYRAYKRGVDLNQTRRYADKLQNELDDLLKQRENAIASASLSGAERQAAEKESEILHDVRDLEVNEFVRWFSQAKGSRVFNYVGYTWAVTSHAIAGAGGITGLHASQIRHGTVRWRARLGGTGGICDIISGSMNQSTPFVIRAAAAIARGRHARATAALLDRQAPGDLDRLHEHQKQYHSLIAAEPQLNVHGVLMRDGVFAKEASMFDYHETLRLGERKAARDKFLSQLIFFTGVGAPKLTNGIGTTVGQFKYWNNPHERFEAIGGPAIVYGTGYCVAEAELMRYQLWTELKRWRARHEGKLTTTQMLNAQMKELEALQPQPRS
jgi:hypothetical protein